MEMEEKRVCVTGDKKYAHLNKLERASDNLKLFKADLLDYDSLRSAIAGCPGVIHVACPVPTSPLVNPENWYMLAKTEAESLAFEFGKKNGLDIVAVNPGYVFGPVLQPTLNFSSLLLLQFVKGTFVESRHNFLMTSEKLQKLGWTYRPLQEMLVDSIENYREAALLD
ncbi:hypothetical protein CRG98_045779 [Punica granatum]|uniref:Uncharacterized protein n=1 Tax=Punica granatum TaxID=22663 RepID=A0A2I0HQ33_PUNGR|nr:hypothetical protein CRG98_045779 [Punica granatum]